MAKFIKYNYVAQNADGSVYLHQKQPYIFNGVWTTSPVQLHKIQDATNQELAMATYAVLNLDTYGFHIVDGVLNARPKLKAIDKLINALVKVDVGAAQWLECNKYVLRHLKDVADLNKALSWNQTPQGYKFWQELAHKLGEPEGSGKQKLQKLIAEIRELDDDAAAWLESKVDELKDAARLGDIMSWGETPQGRVYWARLDTALLQYSWLKENRPNAAKLAADLHKVDQAAFWSFITEFADARVPDPQTDRLLDAFVWADTKQGHDYWAEVDVKLGNKWVPAPSATRPHPDAELLVALAKDCSIPIEGYHSDRGWLPFRGEDLKLRRKPEDVEVHFRNYIDENGELALWTGDRMSQEKLNWVGDWMTTKIKTRKEGKV